MGMPIASRRSPCRRKTRIPTVGTRSFFHQTATETIMSCALTFIAIVVCHVAFARDVTPNDLPTGTGARPREMWLDKGTALRPTIIQNDRGMRTQAAFEPLSGGEPELSPMTRRVSLIADRNGDRDFVMVDKVHGRIILFRNGFLVFNLPALTGESLADQFPADAQRKSWAQQAGAGAKYKVTPAGRFTITRGHDDGLGNLFDINELRGRDWIIAIHQVWLGRRSDHRDARLRSAMDLDKHITDGCVDVDASTMALLSRLVPIRPTPLYILPLDENLITVFFRSNDDGRFERAIVKAAAPAS